MGATVDVDEIDALIDTVRRRGYLWHQFRVDRHGPAVLAGVLRWPTCADVLILIDDHESHAYRTPTGDPGADVFAPEWVHWFYGLSAEVGMAWVLRALLTFPRPVEPGGLPSLVRAPAGLGVPGDRFPVVISKRPGW
jgi:hypothetical protein